MSSAAEKREIVFHGIPASPGIAIGTVLLVGNYSKAYNDPKDRSIEAGEAQQEVSRFNQALDKTRLEIQEIQKHIQSKFDAKEASIFDAHLLIVDDKMFMTEVEEMIVKHLKPADFSFHKIIQRYISAISVMSDPYIKGRVADIEDVSSRILSNIQGLQRPSLDHLPGQRIIIARDLTPSDTALLDRENVQAFGIETGSRTSHTAILARSMQIPAVVGLQRIFDRLENGDLVIIDGFIGTVIINPKEETQNLYALKETREERYYADLLKESRLRPETVDAFCVQLAANIENIDDIAQAKLYGAAGVGLFRTEYLYINSRTLPSEEMQFNIYKKAAAQLAGEPIIIRTLDLGGDKLSAHINSCQELNPFLGLRAVRLCLQQKPEMLITQIRAILKASAFGNVKIMFPMITSADEVDKLRAMVNEIMSELRQAKIPFNENMEFGIMIETPSAALISDVLAKKVDFFSIGTNDLVQYTLAVDRGNENVAYLYQPSHPAILQLIQKIVTSARKNNVWVSVCGEMGSDPRYIPLLVGLGVNELSMSPVSLGIIRRIIRRLKMYEAEELAQNAIKCTSAEEALELSEALLYKIAPDIVSMAIKGL